MLFKKTTAVTPEQDGTYALDQGTKYTIKMKTSSGEFSVQQDNWVYAPNGGKWTPTKYSTNTSITNTFGKPPMSGQMYVPSSKVFDAIEILSGNLVGFERIQSGDIKEQIDFILRNNGMEVKDEELNEALNSIEEAAGATVVLVIEGIVIPTYDCIENISIYNYWKEHCTNFYRCQRRNRNRFKVFRTMWF